MKFILLAFGLLVSTVSAQAHENEAHEKTEAAEAAKNAPALAAALKEAKVSLASGLKAAEKEGTPISGKFEVEDGKLQLSVYTMKGNKYFEVIVDHKSGKVSKTEPITGGEDLAAAKRQAEAMGKTKKPLRDAVTKAEKANAGYKAVAITPEVEEGNAEADVSLLKGTDSKVVDEKL